MRKILVLGMAMLLVGATVQAQGVDPDVRGPLRKGAGAAAEALGAPGVENRIERRQVRRDMRAADADAWRMRFYNDEWWYYTPQNTWMYYRGNTWVPFQADTFQVAPSRHSSNYRGPIPADGYDRYSYGRIGSPPLTIAIRDGQFEPATLQVQPGSNVRWINQGNDLHTVTAVDGGWDSGEIEPGETYSARFKSPGVYSYVCDLHQGMKATIIVGDAGGAVPVDPNAAAPNTVVPGGRSTRGEFNVNVTNQPEANVEGPPATSPTP